MLSHRKAQVVSRISAVGTWQPVVIVLHPHGWNGVGDARSRRQRPLPDRSGPCDTPPSECPEEKYGRGLDHSGNIEGNSKGLVAPPLREHPPAAHRTASHGAARSGHAAQDVGAG
jgi:hypothetical protein